MLWGTGRPRREFLHVDDLADACLFLMQHYDEREHINVGTGEDLTIRELAELVQSIVAPEVESVLGCDETGWIAPEAPRRQSAARARLAPSASSSKKASRAPTGGCSNTWTRCADIPRGEIQPRVTEARQAEASGTCSSPRGWG